MLFYTYHQVHLETNVHINSAGASLNLDLNMLILKTQSAKMEDFWSQMITQLSQELNLSLIKSQISFIHHAPPCSTHKFLSPRQEGVNSTLKLWIQVQNYLCCKMGHFECDDK